MVLLVVGLGPGDDRLPLRRVLIQHAHAEEVAKPLVVVALRVGVVGVIPHALDDLAEDALLLAGLVHRLHQGLPSKQGVLALLLAVAVAKRARPGQLAPRLVVVALPVGAHRQDDVGELGRERELDLEGHASVGRAHDLDGRGEVAARLHEVRVCLHKYARVHRHLAGLVVDRRVGAQLRRVAHHVAGAKVVGALRGGQVLAVGKRAPPGIALDVAVGARGGGAAHQVVHIAVVAADVLDEPVARVARIPRVDGRRTMAALAEVPAQGRHRHEGLGEVLGAQVARGGVAVQEHDGVVLAGHLGVPGNVLNRRAADLRRPFRRLWRVVVGAQQIVAEVLVGGGVGGHGLRREAHGALVHEVPIDDVAALLVEPHHLVGHSQQEGRVGAGAHADPAGVHGGGGGVVVGADEHEVDPRFLGVLQPVHGGVLRPGRITAVQHDGVGVGQIVLIGRHHEVGVVAVGVHAQCFRLEGPAAEGLALGVVHRAANDREHSGAGGPAPAVADDGVLAVLRVDALQLVGHVGQRLVPADALPLVLAAQLAVGGLAATGLPALALHGVLDAVGVVHLLAQRAPAQAAALLGTVEAVGMGVVGLLAHHDAVHHIPHVQAHLVAVLVAVDGHPLAAPLDDGGIAGHLMGRRIGTAAGLGHVGGRARRAAGKPGRRRGGRSGGGRLQEIATLHALVQQSHEHHPPLLVSFLTTRILRRAPLP